MGEYRHTETGEVKTQGEWRGLNKNVSMPRTWNVNVLTALSLEAVLASPAATTSQYQTSVRDGVERDSLGNWVEKYVAQDMFADTTDDGVTTTKAEHEAAYQASLDADVAERNRTKRDTLLAETDWTGMSDVTMASAMATYRQALRDITAHADFPNLDDNDWPTKP
jgi:hypothetical protein|tara:strand:+ start:810 stop:1307 length:498 start_codon:yes stop_codon:yes gene_type:complete